MSREVACECGAALRCGARYCARCGAATTGPATPRIQPGQHGRSMAVYTGIVIANAFGMWASMALATLALIAIVLKLVR